MKGGPRERTNLERSAAMEHYVGLDVSIKETSICVVYSAGRVLREVKVASEPEAIVLTLADKAFTIARIGSRRGRYRNGCTVNWPRQACRSFVSRLGT